MIDWAEQMVEEHRKANVLPHDGQVNERARGTPGPHIFLKGMPQRPKDLLGSAGPLKVP